MLRARLLVVPCALAAVALAAGCGGSSDPGTAGAATAAPAPGGAAADVALQADPGGGLRFTTETLTASAGKVRITMTNPSSSGIPHAIAVEGHGVDRDGRTAGPGGTSTVTVTLKPGTYTFYCPVGQHEQAGMKGALVVQ